MNEVCSLLDDYLATVGAIRLRLVSRRRRRITAIKTVKRRTLLAPLLAR